MSEALMSEIWEENPKISTEEGSTGVIFTNDEYILAKLGYKQEFKRGLGLFESWAATFCSMNFVSGLPVLFGWIMYTGGPKSAFANWTMAGGFSCIVSLSMAEIAATLPTAGGIYYWSFALGGEKWGPFMSWMTAWWNWAGWLCVVPGVQQGSTNFLVSALQIHYPEATIVRKGYFLWILTAVGLLFAMAPNIWSQRILKIYFRFAIFVFFTLFAMYLIWFPIAAHMNGHFQPVEVVFDKFYNEINGGPTQQASDSYCWLIGLLFGAWEFYGQDSSAHLAEETQEASVVVARGIWMSTFSAWIASVPILILVLFCMQDFDGIISATYANNWAEYLVQLLGTKGATAILVILWIDSTCATAACFLSAQRVTYAISRDNILPGSSWFRRLSGKHRMPVNAAILVYLVSVTITCAVIGSTVAFSAITATATIATMTSYAIPITARHTLGRRMFQPVAWNLGRWSPFVGLVATLYISFLFVVLLLPQWFPVTAETLNYAPICIGIITIVSIIGWFLPFGLGGRYWFKGPQRTLTHEEFAAARVIEKDE